MNLQYRVDLLVRLGQYISSGDENWHAAKEKAGWENGWFTPEFVQLATDAIAHEFLQRDKLEKWVRDYKIPEQRPNPRTVGIVMAGNIPLVGFHDFLCVFISGHAAMIKPSSKDDTLLRQLIDQLISWEPEVAEWVGFAPMLKGCDAYIATGSNQSAGYFDYYFSKYPHIIRRNRTSVALLSGNETEEDLQKLADDVYRYFGLGCRNVTKIYVPNNYDFIPLLNAFRKYDYLADHHKYKNNYDYNLAIQILNKKLYMSTPSILLVENPSLFSPISQLNYEHYDDADKLAGVLGANDNIQCVVGQKFIPFGQSQSPGLCDYADGVDTLSFLNHL